ncbi:MAG: glycerate kinase [Bacteroides sp.]|nr:glycerate kinase [Bacteroides sp.]
MNKKIVVASDSFKGSLSSLQVGEAAAKSISSVLPEYHVEVVPVADGGEGTVEAIVSALKGKYVRVTVTGPLGNPVESVYGMCGSIAVIEMSAASGLTLVPPDKRNPWVMTSYGTGELIRDAVINGCRKFIIGIGGSATNDGGIGMLQALGFRFFDAKGNTIGRGGSEAGRVAAIDTSCVLPELEKCSFRVACDVTNPLTGNNGASYIFGPQKGADPEMIEKLDKGLESFSRVVADTCGEDFSIYPGAGGAGGLGFAFLAFLGAKLESGIEMVLDTVSFDSKLERATLVITGEGRLDYQTCMGKTPYGVLQHAKRQGIPVIAIGGAVVPEAMESLMEAGFSSVFPIVSGPISINEALKPEIATFNVERTVAQILRTLFIRI